MVVLDERQGCSWVMQCFLLIVERPMVLMIRGDGENVAAVAALHARSVEFEFSICGSWPRRSILIICWSLPGYLMSRARGA